MSESNRESNRGGMGSGRVILGIDPGICGAIGAIDMDGRFMGVWDLPVETRGKRQAISPRGLSQLLVQLCVDYPVAHICVEQVASMPKQGIASAFNFGESYGLICGLVASCGAPYSTVRPTVWKKSFGLSGADKDQSRTVAAKLFPSCTMLARKKDVDRAEALLLATYALRLLNVTGLGGGAV